MAEPTFDPAQPFTTFDPSQPFTDAPATPPATSGVGRDARGMFPVSSDTTDGPAPEGSALGQLLEPYAHPETLTDFARILTLPVDQVRRAFAAALTTSAARSTGQSISGAVTAAKNLASRMRVTPGAAVKAFEINKPQQALLNAVSLAPETPQMRVPGFDRYLPSQSGYVAPAAAAEAPVVADAVAPVARAGPQLVPRPPPAAPAALVSDPTRASGAALPDQKALNEAALAVRRAAYQASQGKPPPVSQIVKAVATAAKDAKLHLTGAETAAGIDLMKRGLSSEDALKAILTQREFLAKMGGGLPTSAAAKAAIKARGYKS